MEKPLDNSIVPLLFYIRNYREYEHRNVKAESRLASRRAARAEERQLRMKQLERRLKDSEDQYNLYNDRSMTRHRTTPSATRSTFTSESKSIPSYSGSRRNSKDSLILEKTELQHQLEEGGSNGMVNNADLERERQHYSYHIETLKDDLEELEEGYYRLQKDFKDKSRNLELLMRDYAKLKDENQVLKEIIKAKDEENPKLVNGHNGLTNGDANENGVTARVHHFPKDITSFLSQFDGDTLEDKLRQISNGFRRLTLDVEELKENLENEGRKNSRVESEESESDTGSAEQ